MSHLLVLPQFLHPYLHPSPAYSFFSLLIFSFPPFFLFSSSPPARFPTYLICIHLLPDLLCHKTANYLTSLFSLHCSISFLHYCAAFPSLCSSNLLPCLRRLHIQLSSLLLMQHFLLYSSPSFPSLHPPLCRPVISPSRLPPPFLSLVLPSLVPSALLAESFCLVL